MLVITRCLLRKLSKLRVALLKEWMFFVDVIILMYWLLFWWSFRIIQLSNVSYFQHAFFVLKDKYLICFHVLFVRLIHYLRVVSHYQPILTQFHAMYDERIFRYSSLFNPIRLSFYACMYVKNSYVFYLNMIWLKSVVWRISCEIIYRACVLINHTICTELV